MLFILFDTVVLKVDMRNCLWISPGENYLWKTQQMIETINNLRSQTGFKNLLINRILASDCLLLYEVITLFEADPKDITKQK